jgi:hypothetical protein
MKKEQLNQKLSDLEAEAEKLRSLINAPEERTPEAGDVWIQSGDDYPSILGSSGGYLYDPSLNCLEGRTWRRCNLRDATYLGKFDEVYVKISDVREALSIKDDEGDDMMDYINKDAFSSAWGKDKTIDALRKLNIIKD